MPFLFIADPASVVRQDDFTVIISESIKSKDSLLDEFAQQAIFPEYFGKNWDAFDECLRDLSWIRQKRLIIIHKGLPLSNSEEELKLYLEILRDASLDWESEVSHEVIVVFSKNLQKKIKTLLQ